LVQALNATRPLVSPWIVSDSCFDALALEWDLVNNPECVVQAASKAAGYGIVVAASALKLPVIYNIVHTNSVDGLSLSSVYLVSAARLYLPRGRCVAPPLAQRRDPSGFAATP